MPSYHGRRISSVGLRMFSLVAAQPEGDEDITGEGQRENQPGLDFRKPDANEMENQDDGKRTVRNKRANRVTNRSHPSRDRVLSTAGIKFVVAIR